MIYFHVQTKEKKEKKGKEKKKRNFKIKSICQKENIRKQYNYTLNINAIKYYSKLDNFI